MASLLVSADALTAQLSSAGLLIFDVRHSLRDHDAGWREYGQGHIPGALFLRCEDQLAGPQNGRNGRHPLPSLADFAALMRTQGLTSRSTVVVYDNAPGMFAARLWWMLRWLGHENVAILDGGWPAWLAAGGPVETKVNKASVTEAQAIQSSGLGGQAAMPVVNAGNVMDNLAHPVFTLIDARAAARFRGETEPLDPVAGHIPGALNRPDSLNVRPDGFFKSGDALRAEFDQLLQGRAPSAIVHQCGSGISACHNLFAMELAGLHGSALYPGSWSEWCSDASRPVAIGS